MTGLIAALIAAAGLRYDVTASEGARELAVEVRIAPFPDHDGELSVDDGAEPFVRDVEWSSTIARHWRPSAGP